MHNSILLQSIAAGFLISIGCKVNLAVGGTTGAVLFSLALLTILKYGLPLYTGRIAYTWSPLLLLILLGNFIGAFTGSVILGTQLTPHQIETRFSAFDLITFCKAFGCGALMYIAVDCKDKAYMTVLAIATFVLCGFEHCIADIAYIGNSYSYTTVTSLLCIILGNAAGAKIVRYMIGKDRNPPLPEGCSRSTEAACTGA